MSDVLIRELSLGSLESWCKMREKLWPQASIDEHRSEVEELIGEDFCAWVLELNSNPIAFTEASLRAYANGCDSRPVVFLEGIWVDDAFQRRGFARKLVEKVEEWAKAKGIAEIGSDADLENIVSHRWHEASGFEETERVVYFRKKL